MKAIESILIDSRPWYFSKEIEKFLLIISDLGALFLAYSFTKLFTLGLDHQLNFIPVNILGRELLLTRSSVYIALGCLAISSFWLKGHYTKRRPFWSETREILQLLTGIAFLDVALLFFTKWSFSRTFVLLNWCVAPIIFILTRVALKKALISLGGWIRPMMIVGWGDNMLETARAFADEPLMGYQLTAFLIPEEKQKPIFHLENDNGEEIPCISISRNPEALFKRLDSPHLVLALEQGGLDHYQDLIQRLSRLCADLHIVPSLRGLPLYGMSVSHFFSHEVLLLTVRNNLTRRGPQLIKRCFDILAASAILLVGSPFLLMIALGVASSGRPIFFGHKRIGRNGKVFSCYKFRTMLPNSAQMLKDLLERDPEARKEWDRDFKLKNDPRITPLGHFLRKTSLDELPQLWNVVKGEMSLVGPRPVVDAELERYGSNVDLYLEARPGITGIWQISGRNDISYDSRVYLDGWYVKNWSFFNDLVILIKTVKVIFKRDGAY